MVMIRFLVALTLALLVRCADIIGIQRRIREVGRIRLGVQVPTGDGRSRPKKLNRFRFTSADPVIIEAAAGLYGGKAQPWLNDDRPEFEVITDANVIPIMLPPNPRDLGFSQYMELWKAGGCVRRCDGQRDVVRDCACDCDPEAPACKATTRLSVMLPDIPGLGVWRLESHGWNAAVELAAAVEMIEALAGTQSIIPARLRLDERTKKRIVDGKGRTDKFVVPAIDIDVSITQVRALTTGHSPMIELDEPDDEPDERTAPAAGGRFKPVPQLPAPALSVDQQLAAAHAPVAAPRGRRRQAPLPPTGRAPRTAAERAAEKAGGAGAVRHGSDDGAADATEACRICGEPYGSQPLVRNAGPTGGRYVHRDCAREASGKAEGDNDEGIGKPEDPAGQGRGGGGGTDGEPEVSAGDALPAPAAEPPATAGRQGVKMPSAKQHSKIFALLRDLVPLDGGAEPEATRRAYEFGVCEAIGTPGLKSHKEITAETARLLIDALEGLKEGTLRYDPPTENGPGVLRAETGEVVDFGEPFE